MHAWEYLQNMLASPRTLEIINSINESLVLISIMRTSKTLIPTMKNSFLTFVILNSTIFSLNSEKKERCACGIYIPMRPLAAVLEREILTVPLVYLNLIHL